MTDSFSRLYRSKHASCPTPSASVGCKMHGRSVKSTIVLWHTGQLRGLLFTFWNAMYCKRHGRQNRWPHYVILGAVGYCKQIGHSKLYGGARITTECTASHEISLSPHRKQSINFRWPYNRLWENFAWVKSGHKMNWKFCNIYTRRSVMVSTERCFQELNVWREECCLSWYIYYSLSYLL